jgi:hypothetical protein
MREDFARQVSCWGVHRLLRSHTPPLRCVPQPCVPSTRVPYVYVFVPG